MQLMQCMHLVVLYTCELEIFPFIREGNIYGLSLYTITALHAIDACLHINGLQCINTCVHAVVDRYINTDPIDPR